MTMFTWIINIFRKKKKDVITISVDNDTNDITVQKQLDKTPIEIVLNDSKTKIDSLFILTEFFDNTIITDIYNQTEIIHNIFDNNRDMSFKKLEQFHYYYTDTLMEMLSKLRKSIDENTTVLLSQKNAIEAQIEKINKSVNASLLSNDKNVNNLKSQYAEKMSLQLTSIYNCMVDNFNDFRYKPKAKLKMFCNTAISNGNSVTIIVGTEHAWILSPSDFVLISEYDDTNQYMWEEFHIERKLMGKLQKNLFMISYIGMFISGSSYIELFRILDTEVYFVYICDLGIFKRVDYNIIQPLMSNENTKTGQAHKRIKELNDKKLDIDIKLNNIKTIDNDTTMVLNKYLTKIEDVDMINNLSVIDIERKNLESILELTMLQV